MARCRGGARGKELVEPKRTEPESRPEKVVRMKDTRTNVALKHEEEKEEFWGFQNSDHLQFAI